MRLWLTQKSSASQSKAFEMSRAAAQASKITIQCSADSVSDHNQYICCRLWWLKPILVIRQDVMFIQAVSYMPVDGGFKDLTDDRQWTDGVIFRSVTTLTRVFERGERRLSIIVRRVATLIKVFDNGDRRLSIITDFMQNERVLQGTIFEETFFTGSFSNSWGICVLYCNGQLCVNRNAW